MRIKGRNEVIAEPEDSPPPPVGEHEVTKNRIVIKDKTSFNLIFPPS